MNASQISYSGGSTNSIYVDQDNDIYDDLIQEGTSNETNQEDKQGPPLFAKPKHSDNIVPRKFPKNSQQIQKDSAQIKPKLELPSKNKQARHEPQSIKHFKPIRKPPVVDSSSSIEKEAVGYQCDGENFYDKVYDDSDQADIYKDDAPGFLN